MDDGTTMHIGEVAARTDLSLRSLRHWEDVGLLVPSGRTTGGFRLYTEADVAKVLAVRRMKPLGWSLEEMKVVLADIEVLRGDLPDDAPERVAACERLAAVRADAVERRARLESHLAMADEFLGVLDRETSAGE